MREFWARNVALMTGALLTTLAVAFACKQNPPDGARAPAADTVAPAPGAAERGRELYAEQGCASCHSIAGQGNPRFPLDGVGQRRSPAELRDWILGTGQAASRLTARSLQAKERFQSLSEEDQQALVDYMRAIPRR